MGHQRMRAGLLLMTGTAFTVGLILGFLIHLPAVSSPGDKVIRSRHGRDLKHVLSEAASPHNISVIHKHIQQTQNSIDTLRSQGANIVHTHRDKVTTGDKLLKVYDGVYWIEELEVLQRSGFSAGQVEAWRARLAGQRVVGLSTGCGRMQNRLVTFDSADQACARYRINADQMQGELYSYYLSRVLSVHNVPPITLMQPDPRQPTWNSVSEQLTSAQWSPTRVVALTPWLNDLKPAYIPQELQPGGTGLIPSSDLARNRSLDSLVELMQWSDLIVLDYLTGNVDRVVNNMFNQQWNDGMMSSPVHNLERSANLLIFLDNESGLFHSYRLLDKYAEYHETLLTSLCLFRKQTADHIKRLHKSKSIAKEIQTLFEKQDPLHDRIAPMNDKTINILQQRLSNVFKRIIYCENKYKTV